MEGTANGKSEEEKATAELQGSAGDRYDRKGRGDGNENLSCCYPYS